MAPYTIVTHNTAGFEDDPVTQAFDKRHYEQSMTRLQAILREISDTATRVSTWRCPYKNVANRCTANFGCRNQDRTVPAGESFICNSDDNLDYRSAWDVS
jgi:hypothetical protein